jgi:hypothetical protein
MSGSKTSLSQPQIEVLLAGADQKLIRQGVSWVIRREVDGPEGIRFQTVRSFLSSTIKSLCRRGLLDCNFDNPSVHDRYFGSVLDCKIWLRNKYPPKAPLIWTNALGRELLRKKGIFPEVIDNVIAFRIRRARTSPRSHLARSAKIIVLSCYRNNLNLEVA